MIFAKFKNINIKGVNDINYLEIFFHVTDSVQELLMFNIIQKF